MIEKEGILVLDKPNIKTQNPLNKNVRINNRKNTGISNAFGGGSYLETYYMQKQSKNEKQGIR